MKLASTLSSTKEEGKHEAEGETEEASWVI